MLRTFSLALLLTSLVAAGVAKSSRPLPHSRILTVEVTVSEWSPAMVWATVANRAGRRCGGTLDHPFREIPGCTREFEWEQGTPDDPPTGTNADSVPEESKDMPGGIGFTIRDSTAAYGLVREGGCLLQLASEQDGLVGLSVVAEGAGLPSDRDTTSVVVRGQKPSRLWLSWRVEGGKCVAKITRDMRATPKKH
jgi:hypothetical protein